MTTKQKVLKILDKYRDMSLTTGCRLMAGKVEWQFLRKEESALYKDYMLSLNAVGCAGSRNFHQTEIEEKFVITGHPATPLTLLKALGELRKRNYVIGLRIASKIQVIKFSAYRGNDLTYQSVKIDIPLTTTLSEVPEEHEMWQAVLDVLI